MRITDIRLALQSDGKLRAFVMITLNDCFCIRGLKIIEGASGLFVAMPSRRQADGTYRDVAHPVNEEARKVMEAKILGEYRKVRGAGDDGLRDVGVPATSLAPKTAQRERELRHSA